MTVVALQTTNGLGGDRLQQFGFCIGPTSIWWEMVALEISPV